MKLSVCVITFNVEIPLCVYWCLVLWWQAAIGSKALDMAREIQDPILEMYGLDVLTLAVLAILTTAPVGALGIGLAGPRLLDRQVKGQPTHKHTFLYI